MAQQSLEKAIKAILLKLDLADEKDLGGRIKHQIIKGSLELIICRSLVQLLTLINEIFTELKKSGKSDLFPQGSISNVKDKIVSFIQKGIENASTAVTTLYARRKELFQAVEKIGQIVFQKADEKSQKKIDEIIDKIASYNLLGWVLSEIFEQAAIKMGIDTMTKEKEICIEFSKSIVNAMEKVAFHNAIATDLLILMTFYSPFEENVSRIRYPKTISQQEVFTPLNINKDTLIVKWSEELVEFIKKNKIYDRLREFILEQAQSKKSRELLKIEVNRLKLLTKFILNGCGSS